MISHFVCIKALKKLRFMMKIFSSSCLLSFYTLSPLKMGKKEYIVFDRMYVTGRRGRADPQKYIYS